ncbi:SAM-dependent methyltransferase [Amycolatopsis sp. PS_44_ISF1]|uniref:SAM-dependent methyltransferase n=1 Tax=Amycolatopsis sp. PS_44_ISF1 TaxID=2974917 RepID=UPI0028DDE4B9|nr:SAM-dependent methyltransferase [Amycolatopsis sp. PS_44_ISF1]MDT8913359.1 SAM-dependent methyltransferase [Amycolatopsis sp. PS_44_ISF1]
MTETHEQWDIVSGVGLTALAVASARAIATGRPDGLVEDPFAAAFVRAANPPKPMPTGPEGAGGDEVWTAMATYMDLRSRFFDDLLAGSAAPQVVILAAGLDARAYRLDLTGRDVYEVDQPRVLAFKQDVLDGLGARPRCHRHPVATDLREDWPAALAEAGFDRSRPTVWLVEGLLPYLPPDAEEQLFEIVHARSAPGSRIGIEQILDGGAEELAQVMRQMKAADLVGIDLDGLLDTAPRRDPATWLRGQGWTVHSMSVDEAAAGHGRTLPAGLGHIIPRPGLTTADLPR